jgi:uncharacterized integral membrane protein
MRRFAWIITIPVSVIVVVFAVMNRQPVALNLWPLPWDVGAPLFMLTLAAILFGFLLGVAVMWFSTAKQRRRLREAKRALDAAHSELHMLRRQSATAPVTGTAIAMARNRLPPAA